MPSLSNISISKKVASAFVFLFIILMSLGLYGLHETSLVDDRASELRDNWLPSTAQLGKLVSAVKEYRIIEARLIIDSVARNHTTFDRDLTRFAEKEKDVDEGYVVYLPLVTVGTSDDVLMKDFSSAWSVYKKTTKIIVEQIEKQQTDNLIELYYGSDRTNYDAVIDAVIKDLEFKSSEGKKAADKGQEVYATSRLMTIISIVVAGCLCAVAGWIIITTVVRPIRGIVGVVDRFTAGDFDVESVGIHRKDEIGLLARALDVFKRNALEARRLAAEQAAESAAKVKRAASLDALTTGFEVKVGQLVDGLSSAATQMEATAQSMTSIATQTNQEAGAVAAAAEQTSTNVQTVATACEELSASIAEIARQVTQSSKIASGALERARTTDQTARMLATSGQKIGEVVTLIQEIASQTNLLALNATIEAARAGEAGKGFSVVAAEVKALAAQTARATTEIAEQVATIRVQSENSVEAIREISGVIAEMNEITTAIASAVEEQGAATQEIARNVQEAASGTREVSSSICGVQEAANATGGAANQVLGAAGELSRRTVELSAQVGEFLTDVKVA